MAYVEQLRTTVRVVWRENGRRLSETFTQRCDADHFRDLVEDAGERLPDGWIVGQGWYVDERPLFTEAVSAWLQDGAQRRKIQPDTLGEYARLVEREWAPRWRSRAVASILPEEIEAWQQDYSNGRSHKTVMNARGILFGIMRFAVIRGLADGNPMDRVLPPVAERLERTSPTGVHYFDVDQFQAIRVGLCPPVRDLVDVAVLTGCRWGEYTALQVKDCRLSGKHPHVNVLRAFKRRRASLGPVKTDAGFRTVYLSPQAAVTIRRLINGRSPDDFVLVNNYGNPWKSSLFHRYHWHNAVKQARLQVALGVRAEVRMLRHTYAVHMLSAGMPVEVLQRQLGHESLQMTNDLYGGIVDTVRGRLADLYGQELDLLVA